MITLRDFEAFCDADPDWVHDLACRERIGLIQAYAKAQSGQAHTNDLAISGKQGDPANLSDFPASLRG